MNKKATDVVYDICEHMLDHSPERSYKRLNPALRSTLANCIDADLPFQPNTFQRVWNDLRGSFWFGDGAGSHVGEHFYSLACRVNHASAQQSFEAFADRPACIWEEQTKTPFRLHVGARFTWKGIYVTVTSMRQDRLVACTYKDRGVSDRRFTIKYRDIAELRKTAKARVKAVIDRIDASDPANPKEATAINEAINSEHFRHFELEDIRQHLLRHRKAFADRDKIEAWKKGSDGAWLDTKDIYLRIVDGCVECSNGNSITKKTAISVVPELLSMRGKSATLNLPLDSYTIERVDATGVKVGCTLVPWTEIEYLARELKIAV